MAGLLLATQRADLSDKQLEFYRLSHERDCVEERVVIFNEQTGVEMLARREVEQQVG